MNSEQHDSDVKTVLGQSGDFSGTDIVDIILAHPATADFIAGKIYRFFVREDLAPELQTKLGQALRSGGYQLTPFLEKLFLSEDFYSDRTVGSRIKGPVEMVITSYRKLGLDRVPGVPDFNEVTRSLGQELFFPPTVAGWAEGRSWITPGLLLARGNFGYDLLFPDINFIPHDRYPRDGLIRGVNERIAQGVDISRATVPGDGAMMAMANVMADRDEDFNTRFGSYKGWQMAIQKVKPIPRHTVGLELARIVRQQELATVEEAVDYFVGRLMQVDPGVEFRRAAAERLATELGTRNLSETWSYLEEPLRGLIHVIMSAPEYQLG